MKILITGGAGFIGSNFIKLMIETYKDYQIINLDNLTYAGNLCNLKEVENNPNYCFVKGDICDRDLINNLLADKKIDAIINFAAESHVDRSIEDSSPFISTNIIGTHVLLDAAKSYGVIRFVQISTDEIYGSLGTTGYFTETTPLKANSPYSASKAGADLLVRAYYKTYKLPVIITRCSNNYGPYQFPEKLIPLMITNALTYQELPVYGDGLNVRDWLYVLDHCRALDMVFHKGKEGEVYNIGGNNEKTNLEIVKLILKRLDRPESLIRFVKDRLGHDRRYAIDASKITKELGFSPANSFEQGIEKTISWYLENSEWIQKVKNKEYLEYYERMYTAR